MADNTKTTGNNIAALNQAVGMANQGVALGNQATAAANTLPGFATATPPALLLRLEPNNAEGATTAGAIVIPIPRGLSSLRVQRLHATELIMASLKGPVLLDALKALGLK